MKTMLRKVKHYGLKHYCPCCRSRLRRFRPHGKTHVRQAARCPICGSVERHRLMWLFMQERRLLRGGMKFLHVAPEPQLERLVRGVPGIDYLSADLFDPRAMVKMDVCAIQYPDESFDAVCCSHVLEHVPDDRLAMREFRRVLRAGGWAILQVPIYDIPRTLEDPSVTDPDERERLFGQHDHVRKYGPDYEDRLREAGFSVEAVAYPKQLGQSAISRFGLMPSHVIYFCRR